MGQCFKNTSAWDHQHSYVLWQSKASSVSDARGTFIQNSIYAMEGGCSDGTNCAYMDNHAEGNSIRNYPANIGTKYVSKIYWGSVWDNSGPNSDVRGNFYSRFRFLFYRM